jgi:amino acid transporter
MEARTEPATEPSSGRPSGRTTRRGRPVVDRERQYAMYGGVDGGAVFFGWLVAVGVAVLLTALLSAAGAAIGLTQATAGDVRSNADTISVVGGALLVIVLALGYFAGGYVAGRMARFDGGRQGVGVWVFGLVVTLLLAVLGAIAGSQYNVFAQLNLPRVPVDEGSLATGGAIALVGIVVLSLVGAVLGGKAGEGYHRKVDNAGYGN